MSAVDEKQLGHRVQIARQAAGLTQQALCQKAHLSYSTLAKIERGAIKTPSVFTIQSIAAAIGTTLDELVGTPAVPMRRRGQSKTGVKFVFFDVNNTLTRFFYRAFTEMSAEYGIAPDVLEVAFWRYSDTVCRGDMTLDELNAQMMRDLHVPQFDWRRHYLSCAEPMPQMADLVRWTSEHYGVGLITNSMPGLLQDMRAAQLLPDIAYDVVVDSSEVHLLKPERAIYELAQAKAGVAPQEILFTDDMQGNIMAAHALGWRVVLFDDTLPDDSVGRLYKALEPAQI